MGVLATDILLKTCLEAGMADIRKNQWLLDDIYNGLAADPISKAQYGWKEVARAKEWFLSNSIQVWLPFRIDAPNLPCISIVGPSASEMESRANLGDFGHQEEIMPTQATRQPQRVYDPFTPQSYDATTGTVIFPAGITTEVMARGMFLASTKSGKAYVITKVVSAQAFEIAPNINDIFTDAVVVPATELWNLRREMMYMSHTFTIGCHVQGDPATVTWLRDLVMYMLGRYREAYLEARGFGLSSLSVAPPQQDTDFEMERVFKIDITLTGQVQSDWIKWIAPKLAVVKSGIYIANGPKTPESFQKLVADQGWAMEGDETKPAVICNPGNIPSGPAGNNLDTKKDFDNSNETEDEQ